MGDTSQKHAEHIPDEDREATISLEPSKVKTTREQPATSPAEPQQFHSQYQATSYPHHGKPGSAQLAELGPYTMPAPNMPDSFNMGPMATALPNYGSPPDQYSRQMQASCSRPIVGASTPAVVYQIQQAFQYPTVACYPQPTYGSYGQSPYPAGYGQPSSPQVPYGSFPQAQHGAPDMPPGQPYHQNPVPYYYYPDPYGLPPGSPNAYSPQGAPYGGILGQPIMVPDATAGRRLPTGPPMNRVSYMGEDAAMRSHDIPSTSAIPRGPPPKPRQSGHALWVGNLPPGASISALKDHFSRDFTRDIESLFLISKSNCAFVNYRTEEACARAMQKFHDSRFEGVRLVCRLRKGSGAAAGAPTGPGALTGLRRSFQTSNSNTPVSKTSEPDDSEAVENEQENEVSSPPATASEASERYFIVKSLTLQDLEQSVRNGIWATQSHNEKALNKAYDSADNVYLVFSANKSGEYFGYARMASSIAENASEIFGAIPRTEANELTDAPRSISTTASESAPRGRIIDDSGRGTIFWEAELTDDEQEDATSEPSDGNAEPPTWGKPFKIEWMSTTRMPFYRTRGLRNPWNANRDVKVARDGTELEPSVGKRLIQLFHPAGPSQKPILLARHIYPLCPYEL